MSKQYDDNLVQALKRRQKEEDYHGAPVLVKYLPDCDEPGAMDPRLYRDQKKALRMMAWMPSFLMKMDTSEKGIANLRQTFNGIKSIPCVEAPICIETRTVPAEDGYEIPVRIYKARKEDTGKAILYYIHGGGFFGGSPDVVEESVKMFVAKTGLCAVSVDYRLAPENPYPTGHQDCYRVLKWIGENAPSFGGDPAHIFVAGDSAGGNLAQYCSTRDREDGGDLVKGQLLLYPTLNMAGVKDELFQPGLEHFEMAPGQRRGLKKMLGMFAGMTSGLEPILGTKDVRNDYLNPYTRDPANNPPTFLTVGEHDFLKVETLGYGVKLHRAGVETRMVLYKGFGHAFFDNTGVYPQTEDCIDEMADFIRKHCEE
ncbi:MAG: alpha/beta hydrolase [Oscillospiraceae bacterium]